MRAFAVFYCTLFCPVWLLFLGILLFPKEEMDLGKSRGGGLREMEVGGTVIGIYCMGEESIFN